MISIQRFALSVGDVTIREDLAIQYGGSKYSGGIVPSNTTSNIFLFTDPAEASKYGYTYDGFSEDRSVLYYTGAGTVGDQLESSGNRSVLRHATTGHTLRVFAAAGKVAGTRTKLQKYVGKFAIDNDHPFDRMPAVDRKGRARTVLVFRLHPMDEITDEAVALAGTTAVTLTTLARSVPLEVDSSHFYETSGREPGVALRSESALTAQFVESRPHSEFSRWAISLPNERTTLLTDVYDTSSQVLYEAKALESRANVRTAIGQLYDYRRHIDVRELKCTVLLPARPSNDLRDLLRNTGLGLTYRDGHSFHEAFSAA